MWPPQKSNSRSVSPLPRRTSSARGPYLAKQRPGPASNASTPRSSSLTLVSPGDSTVSLLASAKRANGSNLKQSTTVDDALDPEEKLESILGPPPAAEQVLEKKGGPAITEEDLVIDFDFDDLSLRELAGASPKPQGQNVYRPQTVQEYEHDKENFEELHRSIKTCDDILSSVEFNLTSFRNDLAAVSADIETLQARSTALNVRLENRRAVEKGLGPVVEEISVSPVVVSKIADGHIDETWAKALAEVDKRATLYKNGPGQNQSKGWTDLGPLLDKLTTKAIQRIRDFLVAQVKALRSPHINAQIIQQQNFLRFKDLYAFLHRHQPTLAEEICQAYMNTMRWYYLNQFTRYRKALEKIKLHTLDKNDVLGCEDTSRRSTVLSSGSSRLTGPPHDAFNLGRRMDALRTGSQTALPAHVAEDDKSTQYLEVPFRSFNLALTDNATAEYTFLAGYFGTVRSAAAVSRCFNYIWEPTFALGQALTRQLAGDAVDGLGLLLCLRINQRLAFELQRRRVPAADGYINGTAMALWPRLQSVMDAHCESVRALTAALPTHGGGGSGNKNASAAPHVLTQRFGQLLHGVLVLSPDPAGAESVGAGGGGGGAGSATGGTGGDEPIVASITRLRAEVEAFLTRYSRATFGSADRRKRERFLYNNYSLVLTIISDTNGRLAGEQQEHFERLKTAFQEAA